MESSGSSVSSTLFPYRTPGQDGLGAAFPSTSGVEGFTAEKAKGRVLSLEGGASWRTDMRVGLLTPEEAKAAIKVIERIRSG